LTVVKNRYSYLGPFVAVRRSANSGVIKGMTPRGPRSSGRRHNHMQHCDMHGPRWSRRKRESSVWHGSSRRFGPWPGLRLIFSGGEHRGKWNATRLLRSRAIRSAWRTRSIGRTWVLPINVARPSGHPWDSRWELLRWVVWGALLLRRTPAGGETMLSSFLRSTAKRWAGRRSVT